MKESTMIWAGLAALALLYFSRKGTRQASPAPAAKDTPGNSLAGGPDYAGAPLLPSNLAQAYAGYRSGELSSVGAPPPATTTGTTTGGTTGTGSNPPPATTPPPTMSTGTPTPGPGFDWWITGTGPGTAPLPFRNPSGGFNSGAFQFNDWIEWLSGLSDLIGGTGSTVTNLQVR